MMQGLIIKIKKILSIIAKIFSSIFFAVILVVGCFLVYYFVAVRIYSAKGEDYKPLYSLYTIVSASMEPNVKVYDVIFSQRVSRPEDIEVGDIITFTSHSAASDGLTVTHRVVGISLSNNGVLYQTKGDNNFKSDSSKVPFNDIIGKTLFVIPQLGRVQFLVASKGGWFLIVLLPAFGVIIYDIIKVVKFMAFKQQAKIVPDVINVEAENDEEKKRQQALKDQLLTKRGK